MFTFLKKKDQTTESNTNSGFEITISAAAGGYKSDKSFENILSAIEQGKRIKVNVEDNMLCVYPNIYVDKREGFIEFSHTSYLNRRHIVHTLCIDYTGHVDYMRDGLSSVKIELERVDDTYIYRPATYGDDILVAIQEMRDDNVNVEIIADCQPYPYIRGNQEEAFFGRIDPDTGDFITFAAHRSMDFVRYTRPIG